jgi:uronate dehydrogenase
MSDMPRGLVLVTGSAGRVSTLVLPALRALFRLRLFDVVDQAPGGDDEVVQADARDVEAVQQAADGATAIVHLAAHPDEADFRRVLLPHNLDAAWAVFEAARRSAVPRLVFASSVQVVGGYPQHVRVPPDAEPRPVSTYACTKAFGEALARYHADASGIGVACLRIGAVMSPDDPRLVPPSDESRFWCSPGDLARLIAAAIESDVPFATVNAVSPPATARFDTANPFGWQPLETPVAADDG